MKTTLRVFRSDARNKQYTKCERGHIIGSDNCRGCIYFVGKIVENEKKDGKYTLVAKGIVECANLEGQNEIHTTMFHQKEYTRTSGETEGVRTKA